MLFDFRDFVPVLVYDWSLGNVSRFHSSNMFLFLFPVPVVSTTGKRRLSNGPRVCEQCNKAFKYPSDLKKHLQIHTGKFTEYIQVSSP
jgi:uncharacterized Zn-finger protein